MPSVRGSRTSSSASTSACVRRTWPCSPPVRLSTSRATRCDGRGRIVTRRGPASSRDCARASSRIRAEADLARFEVGVLRSEGGLRAAQAAFAAAVGVTTPLLDASDQSRATVEVPPLDAVLSRAAELDPAIREAVLRMRAARERVRAAGAQSRPEIWAIGTVNGAAGGAPRENQTTQTWGAGAVPWVPDYFVGAVLAWRFYDPVLRAREDTAAREQEVALAEQGIVQQESVARVEQTWVSLLVAVRTLVGARARPDGRSRELRPGRRPLPVRSRYEHRARRRGSAADRRRGRPGARPVRGRARESAPHPSRWRNAMSDRRTPRAHGAVTPSPKECERHARYAAYPTWTTRDSAVPSVDPHRHRARRPVAAGARSADGVPRRVEEQQGRADRRAQARHASSRRAARPIARRVRYVGHARAVGRREHRPAARLRVRRHGARAPGRGREAGRRARHARLPQRERDEPGGRHAGARARGAAEGRRERGGAHAGAPRRRVRVAERGRAEGGAERERAGAARSPRRRKLARHVARGQRLRPARAVRRRGRRRARCDPGAFVRPGVAIVVGRRSHARCASTARRARGRLRRRRAGHAGDASTSSRTGDDARRPSSRGARRPRIRRRAPFTSSSTSRTRSASIPVGTTARDPHRRRRRRRRPPRSRSPRPRCAASKATVFVVEGDVATLRAVAVLGRARPASSSSIRSSLPGARVVTEGRALLSDGDRVAATLERRRTPPRRRPAAKLRRTAPRRRRDRALAPQPDRDPDALHRARRLRRRSSRRA